MSLVGSLEDLGLGDILQIISLSGKSGALILRSGDGEGQILFQNGLLRGAFAKDEPTSLRDLVASRGLVPQAALDAACEDARGRGVSLSQVLTEQQLLDGEAIDALRRENIEAAVFKMFGWPTGEFSFEVHELDDTGEDLFVTPGINPQFLALEGTRRVDEDQQEVEVGEPIFDGEAPPADEAAAPVFEDASPMPLLDEDALQVEAVPAEALAEGVEDEGEALEAELLPEDDEAVAQEVVASAPHQVEQPAAAQREESVSADDPTPAVSPEPRRTPPLVVIDGELQVLEWLKTALASDFPRIHIFQRSDLGIQRIRQYLARAEVPVVLLATDAPGDAITGARDPGAIVARLKRLAARMPVFLMGDPNGPAKAARLPGQPRERARPDGIVERPGARDLTDPRRGPERDRIARALREALRASGSFGGTRADHPAAALARLREVSARISDPSSRGAVLREVLSFAAQVFSRVALFMVVEDRAVGIAQVGLPRGGGPDEAGLRNIHLGAREPAWFRTVLERQEPVRAAPADEGDQRLAVMLGNEIPDEAWVAPILSAERIVALLYGDNLPGGQPIGDTGALEVLLDSAGMALDRAFLETLAEA